MDQLDREVIESLSEPAKRVFGSLDYRSRQRMLKKAKAMAKKEKTRNQKKSRVKKKGIEKQQVHILLIREISMVKRGFNFDLLCFYINITYRLEKL